MSTEVSEDNNFWEVSESIGVMPGSENTIKGEVQDSQKIPLGATHSVMFPQTNAIMALVLAIGSFACGGGLILSIPALLVALSAKKITDGIPTHPDRGIANVAYVTSIVNICLSSLLIIIYTGVFVFYMSA